MKIYLVGSIAFDEIGLFPGRFDDVIKSEHLDKLSVCFSIEDKKRFFGGCAGNVAYSLGLLGMPATLCCAVGEDIGDYLGVLKGQGMNIDYLVKGSGHTPHAFIVTDSSGNQIANFAPGVLGREAADFELPEVATEGDFLLVSPENHDRMLDAARQGAERGMKVFFDPGQMIHTFSGEELLGVLDIADGLFTNDYEWELFCEISGLKGTEIMEKVDFVCVTKGEDGADIYENGEKKEVASAEIDSVMDPTGAGDAFRAGVLAGLMRGLDLERCAQIGSLLGAECARFKETQGHELSEDLVNELKKLGFEL